MSDMLSLGRAAILIFSNGNRRKTMFAKHERVRYIIYAVNRRRFDVIIVHWFTFNYSNLLLKH